MNNYLIFMLDGGRVFAYGDTIASAIGTPHGIDYYITLDKLEFYGTAMLGDEPAPQLAYYSYNTHTKKYNIGLVTGAGSDRFNDAITTDFENKESMMDYLATTRTLEKIQTKVKLTYYKDTGKYYTESEFLSDNIPVQFDAIVDEVLGMIKANTLNGTSSGTWDGPILVDVIDHDGSSFLTRLVNLSTVVIS